MTGQCWCKDTIHGRTCNTCQEGFHTFPTTGQGLCRPCLCNPGGSVNASCDVTGQCYCLPHVSGLKCDDVSAGQYSPALDHLSLQPVRASSCRLDSDIRTPDNLFTGSLYAVCTDSQTVVFEGLPGLLDQPNVTELYFPGVRYSRNESLPAWSSFAFRLRPSGDSGLDFSQYGDAHLQDSACPLTSDVIVELNDWTSDLGQAVVVENPVSLDVRCRYEFLLEDSSPVEDAGSILIDSLVWVPDYTQSGAYQAADNATRSVYERCVLRTLSLATRENTLGTDEICRDFTFAVMIAHGGGAESCSCDSVGSVSPICDSVGGQCPCKPGVGGRACDRCETGFFNFTETGCQSCDCSPLGSSSPVCDAISGQCPCLQNVATSGAMNQDGDLSDRRCSACMRNYYGFSSGRRCAECLCDPVGSAGLQCDRSGQCPCRETIGGQQCDECLPGYFQFGAQGCSACECSEEGSTSVECHQTMGVCTCKQHTRGDKCDLCESGYFNLQAGNPGGCQPCFCYGHSATCISAPRYQERVSIATYEQLRTWPITSPLAPTQLRTHRSAHVRFLGNQLYAYAQLMTLEVRAGLQPINLTDERLVILQGREYSAYLSLNDVIAAGQVTTLQVPVHESYFRNSTTQLPVSSFILHALLAELSSMEIQQNFGATSLSLLQLSWPGAEPLVGDNTMVTGSVELCECSAERNVKGSSCETCSQGHRRVAESGDSYDVCVSCDCSDNSATSPPNCDQLTGECLNCRPGTQGFRCELCDPHVTAPDCVECEDGYWGLSHDGCQPCDCDPIGALNGVCDKDSGQCACAANIQGRQCDVCADNHFNLQASGCSECGACYKLVGDQVNILREMRANLSLLLTELQGDDLNSQLGAFMNRKAATVQSVNQLMQFLDRAQEVEGPVIETITALNASLLVLRMRLDNDVTHILELANETTVEVELVIATARDDISFTEITVREAENLVHTVIEPMTRQLEEVVATMQHLETEISSLATGSLGHAVQLGQTVLDMEEDSQRATTLATASLQTVQENLATHVITNGKITEATNFLAVVRSLAHELLFNSEALTKDTSGITAAVETAQTTIEQLPELDEGSVGVAASENAILGTSIQALLDQIQRDPNTELAAVNISGVQTNTSAMVTQADQIRAIIDDYTQRMTDARTEVHDAQQLVNSSLTDARRMLNITSNFDLRASVVSEEADQSLASVAPVVATSESAITSATTVSQALQDAVVQSNHARRTAQNASDLAVRHHTHILSMLSRIAALQERYPDILTNPVPRANSLVEANVTRLAPASQTCTEYSEQVEAIADHVENLQVSLDNTTTQINSTHDRLNDVIREVQQVPSIDTRNYAILRQSVVDVRTELDDLGVAREIRRLTTSIVEKRAWLVEMRARKDELHLQVQRLREIRSQLNL